MFCKSVALFTVFFHLAPCAALSAASGEAAKEGVRLLVALPKNAAIVGEPILATISIRNETGSPLMIADTTENYRVVSAQLTKLSAKGDMPSPRQIDYLEPADEIRQSVQPGEARSIAVDVLDQYIGAIPEGLYELRVRYKPPDSVSGIWHGSIEVSGIQVSVGTPPQEELLAAQQFMSGRYSPSRPDSCIKLGAIAEPAKGGRFADYAGYWEARAWGDKKEYDRAIEASRRYLERHADVPHYGNDIRNWLSFWLRVTGDLTAARSELLRTPDGFERRMRLKQIDKAIEKRAQERESADKE